MHHLCKQVLLYALITGAAVAQEKSAGKLSGLMFGDYFYNAVRDTGIARHSNVANGGAKDLNGIQFRRIYLTYDHEISAKFLGRLRLEADNVSTLKDDRIGVFVKDAYLRWRNIFEGSDLLFGIQPTPAFDVSESAWNYRSLEKTIMDLRGIVSSRDVAVSLKGMLDEGGAVNYWVMLGNGSGNRGETDKYKRIYLNLHLKPSPRLQINAYGDLRMQRSIRDPNSITDTERLLNHVLTSAVFLGWVEKDAFMLGIEGFLQTTLNGVRKGTAVPFMMTTQYGIGLSLFGYYHLDPACAFVGRVDYVDPNTDTEFRGDSRVFIIGGLSWKPDENVSVMPNVIVETYEALPSSGNLAGRAITPSVTPRITFHFVFL